jgi:hypothetical protein
MRQIEDETRVISLAEKVSYRVKKHIIRIPIRARMIKIENELKKT